MKALHIIGSEAIHPHTLVLAVLEALHIVLVDLSQLEVIHDLGFADLSQSSHQDLSLLREPGPQVSQVLETGELSFLPDYDLVLELVLFVLLRLVHVSLLRSWHNGSLQRGTQVVSSFYDGNGLLV